MSAPHEFTSNTGKVIGCASRLVEAPLHGNRLARVPRRAQLLLLGGGHCGCFVTDIRPMETLVGLLKMTQSQQASQFGEHLKRRSRKNKKAKGSCTPITLF